MTTLTLALLGLLIVISPGADFALVLKNSLVYGRRAGIHTALGIGLAIGVHISYSLLGISYLISQSQWLFTVIRYAGAAYLIYLGIKGLCEKTPEPKSTPHLQAAVVTQPRTFMQGFFCNALNPKTMLFFLSIFSQILGTNDPHHQEALLYGFYLMALHGIWFCLLALFVTTEKLQQILRAITRPVQHMCSLGLISFGALLALRS
ncbi:LysE family translocator [Vibrio mangrovi]|uniref:LysE family translocator n=1 Tax=Vibrio mangrovi TaxID=474394 RepID=A0A1Y6J1Q3_9VIBR|nr:LysE family translocator [Vibrio mangrovi]MDW6002761.1 LysE family translocator [Vibrio mangrovi]SMS02253.1 Threonine efflux protein [Vibrio mangrovi]